MFTTSSRLFLFLFSFCVLSKQVTFKNVKVQYQTEDYEEYTDDIESADSLKEVLETDEITRITVIGNSVIPVLSKDSVSDLPKLKILQFRQHGIEEIEVGAFQNIPLLEILRLNGNELKEIKDGVFNNLNLVFLNLDHNRIEKISSGAFDNLKKLKVLDLSYNKLKNFYPEWLDNKPDLGSVILNYNEIEFLPNGALENYQNDIDFSNNRIKNMSRDIFGENQKIGQLWLNDNYIDSWEESFLQNISIRVFDISRNNLECLEGDFENFFVAFRTRIDGNPWECECLRKIVKWVQEEKVSVKMKNSVRNCNST